MGPAVLQRSRQFRESDETQVIDTLEVPTPNGRVLLLKLIEETGEPAEKSADRGMAPARAVDAGLKMGNDEGRLDRYWIDKLEQRHNSIVNFLAELAQATGFTSHELQRKMLDFADRGN